MIGAIAQLVEHLHGMQGVRGSNPLGSIYAKSLPDGEDSLHRLEQLVSSAPESDIGQMIQMMLCHLAGG
jgi:hypothetical protein